MKIKEITNLINTKFPLSLAIKHDKVGLQVGKEKWEVNKVLVALDLTSSVLQEAITSNCQMLIVHHPFFYNSQKKELQLTYKKQIYKQLLTNKISVYVTHTSYDQQMNLEVLKELKAKNIQELVKHDVGKKGILKAENSLTVLTKLQKIFKIANYTVNMPIPSKIKTIALCMGAGGNLISKINFPIDLYVTGEVKWNEWILATEKKIPVICFNHSMENYYLTSYSQMLKQLLPANVQVLITSNKSILKNNS